jgi:hypothetical protein
MTHKEYKEGGEGCIVGRMGREEAIVILSISSHHMEHLPQLRHITGAHTADEGFYDEITHSCRQSERDAYCCQTDKSLAFVAVVVQYDV